MTFSDSSSSSAWLGLLDNAVLAWGLAACGLAQLSKLIVELILYRRWRPAVLLETGGMPSSHSALVTGTAAGVGWEMGFDHSGFALAATV
ncbi:MAG TPA: divergent PAP2 family protein, partial [Prochlorococcus sp.]